MKTRSLAGASVGSSQLAPKSVGSASIADDSIDQGPLKTDSVGSDEIQSGAVGAGEIRGDSIGGGEIRDGSIGPSDLADNAVLRLFAHVSSSGQLAESAGAVSAGRISQGQFYVTFNRSLRGCVAVASVGFGFGPGVIGAGGTAQPRMNLDNDDRKVGLTVYRKGWTFNDVEDNDVSVIVMC